MRWYSLESVISQWRDDVTEEALQTYYLDHKLYDFDETDTEDDADIGITCEEELRIHSMLAFEFFLSYFPNKRIRGCICPRFVLYGEHEEEDEVLLYRLHECLLAYVTCVETREIHDPRYYACMTTTDKIERTLILSQLDTDIPAFVHHELPYLSIELRQTFRELVIVASALMNGPDEDVYHNVMSRGIRMGQTTQRIPYLNRCIAAFPNIRTLTLTMIPWNAPSLELARNAPRLTQFTIHIKQCETVKELMDCLAYLAHAFNPSARLLLRLDLHLSFPDAMSWTGHGFRPVHLDRILRSIIALMNTAPALSVINVESVNPSATAVGEWINRECKRYLEQRVLALVMKRGGNIDLVRSLSEFL